MTDVNRRLDLCENAPTVDWEEQKRLTLQQEHEQGIIDLATFNGFEYDIQNAPNEYEQAVIYLDGLDHVEPFSSGIVIPAAQSLSDKLSPDVD